MSTERKNQKSLSRKIVFTVAFVVFVLYSVVIFVIFLQGFFISVKKSGVGLGNYGFNYDKRNANLFSFYAPFAFDNYIKAFSEFSIKNGVKEYSYLEMTWHSIWRATAGSGIGWMSTIMVCYVLVHYKSKFVNFLYSLGLVISIIPLYGAGAAEYKLFSDLNLIDNPLRYLTSISLFGGHFFYMYAFWKAISWSYAEAAEIDGANDYQIFFKVMLPMLVPSAIALFVMSFISGWNNYSATLLYMKAYPNLAYGVYVFEEIGIRSTGKPVYFAGVLISLIPILALFLTFQNTIMEKVYLGGLKG
jgi:ABC-type glycerol-3-phosphate transport system permease component